MTTPEHRQSFDTSFGKNGFYTMLGCDLEMILEKKKRNKKQLVNILLTNRLHTFCLTYSLCFFRRWPLTMEAAEGSPGSMNVKSLVYVPWEGAPKQMFQAHKNVPPTFRWFLASFIVVFLIISFGYCCCIQDLKEKWKHNSITSNIKVTLKKTLFLEVNSKYCPSMIFRQNANKMNPNLWLW